MAESESDSEPMGRPPLAPRYVGDEFADDDETSSVPSASEDFDSGDVVTLPRMVLPSTYSDSSASASDSSGGRILLDATPKKIVLSSRSADKTPSPTSQTQELLPDPETPQTPINEPDDDVVTKKCASCDPRTTRGKFWRNQALALVCVSLVCVSFLAQAELTQIFFVGTGTASTFKNYYFLTWWSYSALVVLLPAYVIGVFFCVCVGCVKVKVTEDDETAADESTMISIADPDLDLDLSNSKDDSAEKEKGAGGTSPPPPPLSLGGLLKREKQKRLRQKQRKKEEEEVDDEDEDESDHGVRAKHGDGASTGSPSPSTPFSSSSDIERLALWRRSGFGRGRGSLRGLRLVSGVGAKSLKKKKKKLLSRLERRIQMRRYRFLQTIRSDSPDSIGSMQFRTESEDASIDASGDADVSSAAEDTPVSTPSPIRLSFRLGRREPSSADSGADSSNASITPDLTPTPESTPEATPNTVAARFDQAAADLWSSNSASEAENDLVKPLTTAEGGGGGENTEDEEKEEGRCSSSRWEALPWRNKPWKRYLNIGLAALVFAPLQFGSGYLWLSSLSYIPVCINHALNQSENVVVFVLSLIFCLPKEKTNIWLKGVLVIVGVAGFIILGWSGSVSTEQFPNAMLGIGLDVGQMLLYAIYEVIFAKWFPEEKQLDTFECIVLQSMMGFVHFAVFGFGIFILHWTGVETLDTLVFNPKTLAFLVFTAFSNVSFEVLIALALAFSQSPIYVSMSRSSVVVGSVIVDTIFRGIPLEAKSWVALPVVTGVIISLNIVAVKTKDTIAEAWLKRKWELCFCPSRAKAREAMAVVEDCDVEFEDAVLEVEQVELGEMIVGVSDVDTAEDDLLFL